MIKIMPFFSFLLVCYYHAWGHAYFWFWFYYFTSDCADGPLLTLLVIKVLIRFFSTVITPLWLKSSSHVLVIIPSWYARPYNQRLVPHPHSTVFSKSISGVRLRQSEACCAIFNRCLESFHTVPHVYDTSPGKYEGWWKSQATVEKYAVLRRMLTLLVTFWKSWVNNYLAWNSLAVIMSGAQCYYFMAFSCSLLIIFNFRHICFLSVPCGKYLDFTIYTLLMNAALFISLLGDYIWFMNYLKQLLCYRETWIYI